MHEAAAPSWADFIGAIEIFRDPLICAAVGGFALGFLGVYVLLRRMVFVGATITQAAALGVALSFYAQIHLGLDVEPVLGAATTSLLATLLLLVEERHLGTARESLLGLAYAATGGLAVLVGDRIAQEAHDIQSILFGTAVLVRPTDLVAVVATASVALIGHLAFFRGLSFASFDPVAARVQGLPVRSLQAVVLVTIGLVVGVTARALGALPVFALSTLPAMAALVLRTGVRSAFAIAAVLGAVAGVGGYLFAFFLGFPVGASQTAVAAALVGAAWLARLVVRRG
jgi:zinc transport system permease protein